MSDAPSPAPLPRDLATLAGRALLPPELRHASGLKRLEHLLELANVAEVVPSLATEELYLLLRDIGKTDAYPLLAHASDEQLQGLVDLDAWQKDQLLVHRWLEWLDLALAVDLETGLRYVAAQDDETLEWLFIKDINVHGNDLDTSTVPDELLAFESPDGMYWVTLPEEHELAERLPQLMKLLWAADADRARLIFDQIRFDLPASVEEHMLHFHDGRLRDLGFDPPAEAAALFTRVDPRALKRELRDALAERSPVGGLGLGAVASDLALRDVKPPELLGAALERLDATARAGFGEGFTVLVNRVFMATTGDVSRVDELPTAAHHAAAYANLGLAWLADEDVARAAELLGRVWAVELFQVGHSLVTEVGLRARKIEQRAGARHGLTLFGAPVDETLHGLALPRPLLYAGLTEPGRLDYRPVGTLAELARAEIVVADADAVLTFFERSLGFTPERIFDAPDLAALGADARARIRFATLLRTGLAHLLLTDALRFAPLAKDELAAFARAAFTPEGQLSPRLSVAVGGFLADAPDAVATFARRALDDLVDALGPVAPDDVDPRFTGDLFLTFAG